MESPPYVPPDYESEEWEDVIPIPQNEGGSNPLAAIAYTAEYSQASDYLRAVMAANEKSARVLALTEHMIKMNPAHYTVWIYRASVTEALGIPPEEELVWLTKACLRSPKNYQIWQHRQTIISRLETLPSDETKVLEDVLRKDAKNYHVWSYRQWLVKRFGLWADDEECPGGATEIAYVEKLLKVDVRNNSAWNHRYFVIFKKPGRTSMPVEIVDREIRFAKEKADLAPQNQSAWNYLKGVMRFAERPTSELKDFAQQYANVDGSKVVASSHALDILAEIWAQENDSANAIRALDLLGEKYDPIRKNYWEWRKSLLPTAAAS